MSQIRKGAEVFSIGCRRIGRGCPTFIVAELSANHTQDLQRAERLVEAARKAGADAVKLQTYKPYTMTVDAPGEMFQAKGDAWKGMSLYQVYQEAYTPWEWHAGLMDLAHRGGLEFFSSPFDATAVDFLEDLGVPAYKIASFEIVDIPLIQKAAGTGKPLILSTGMATQDEITEAVDAARDAGCNEIALLKCTSAYPSSPAESHLATIPDMMKTWGVPVGLSDHTLGIGVPVASVALGACIIEKHLTLSRDDPTPDQSFSLEPSEFRMMVESVRQAEQAVGEVHYGATQSEVRTKRRSLFVVEDVEEGETLTVDNVRSIRPGHGLHPRHLPEVLGRAARRAIRKGTPLDWEAVSEEH